jgi:carbon storage regulator
MLYLTRRAGEAVIINNAIEVRVVEVRGRTVRLGFRFPPEASVLREEVFLQIRSENEAAAKAAADGPVDLALLQELDQAVDPGKAKPP